MAATDRTERLERIAQTGEIITADLEPLGIPFEGWLRWCQLPDANDRARRFARRALELEGVEP